MSCKRCNACKTRRKAERRVRAVQAALAEIAAEADEWRAEHGSDDDTEPDYASGLLSAVHDVCVAAGIEWPKSAPARGGV